MLLYVVTGLHGSHVALGLIAIAVIQLTRTSESITLSSVDTCHQGGVLGVLLYWHFVDFVWVSILGLLYLGSICT
jgi:cytochrome c oxidase subunit 3